jgi:hypothetical protein
MRNPRTTLLNILKALVRGLNRLVRVPIQVVNLDRQKRKPLANIVMQLSRDTPALLFLRFDQTATDLFERITR